MWQIENPKPVKLIVGILAADQTCLEASLSTLKSNFGEPDFVSPAWSFDQTDYYRLQAGDSIIRRFVTFEQLIDPGDLAKIKHQTNQMEQILAEALDSTLPRPVNLDPGFIEPSKLVLASTKNFSHRIYIGNQMYAEVTLMYSKGQWQSLKYTFPDYKQAHYHNFFNKARSRLVEQLKNMNQ